MPVMRQELCRCIF